MVKSIATLQEVQFQAARRYALWRIGATPSESRTYNTTKRIMLTFDDGGTPKNVRGILQVLKEQNVRAFFFLVGEWAEKNQPLIKEMEAAGHWIGNHTYSHARLTDLTDDEIRAEVSRGLATKICRPPYGAYNKRVRKVINQLGMDVSFWTIDSDDWKGIDAPAIAERVLRRLHPGACVLLHLNTPHTLEALPTIIEGIRARGYELCHDGTEITT